jgi:hypothetical protein
MRRQETSASFKNFAVKKIVNLPNVGKCDHTYLYHIINNYNNLSKILVFLPGSINMENKKNTKQSCCCNFFLFGVLAFISYAS